MEVVTIEKENLFVYLREVHGVCETDREFV